MAKPQQEFYERFWDEWEPRDAVERLMHQRRQEALKRLLPRTARRVLFIGCGYGEELSAAPAPSFGLDLSAHGLLRARDRWQGQSHQFIQADAAGLPFKSGSFDCVVCASVFEHILKRKEMLLECRRVLGDNGLFILDVPNWFSFYGLFRKVYEVISRQRYLTEDQTVDDWFTPRSLAATLEPAFRIVSRRGIWFFPPTGLRKHHLPARLIRPVFKFLLPLDRFLGRVFPSFGQLLALVCQKVA